MNAFRISSGKGASKSSDTVNSPLHKPNGLGGFLLFVIGCNSAIALSS